jgi:hypothetical protein
LNHAKTATWVLEQVWSEDCWRMRTDKSLPGTLHLEDEDGVRRPIKRRKTTEDHKILGVHITGDHTWKAQISQQTMQGVAFSARVRTCKNKVKTDMWFATKSMI